MSKLINDNNEHWLFDEACSKIETDYDVSKLYNAQNFLVQLFELYFKEFGNIVQALEWKQYKQIANNFSTMSCRDKHYEGDEYLKIDYEVKLVGSDKFEYEGWAFRGGIEDLNIRNCDEKTRLLFEDYLELFMDANGSYEYSYSPKYRIDKDRMYNGRLIIETVINSL